MQRHSEVLSQHFHAKHNRPLSSILGSLTSFPSRKESDVLFAFIILVRNSKRLELRRLDRLGTRKIHLNGRLRMGIFPQSIFEEDGERRKEDAHIVSGGM